jgi:hypothetical protein
MGEVAPAAVPVPVSVVSVSRISPCNFVPPSEECCWSRMLQPRGRSILLRQASFPSENVVQRFDLP